MPKKPWSLANIILGKITGSFWNSLNSENLRCPARKKHVQMLEDNDQSPESCGVGTLRRMNDILSRGHTKGTWQSRFGAPLRLTSSHHSHQDWAVPWKGCSLETSCISGACQENVLLRLWCGPLLPWGGAWDKCEMEELILALCCVNVPMAPPDGLFGWEPKTIPHRLSLTSGWHLVPRRHSNSSRPGKLQEPTYIQHLAFFSFTLRT